MKTPYIGPNGHKIVTVEIIDPTTGVVNGEFETAEHEAKIMCSGKPGDIMRIKEGSDMTTQPKPYDGLDVVIPTGDTVEAEHFNVETGVVDMVMTVSREDAIRLFTLPDWRPARQAITGTVGPAPKVPTVEEMGELMARMPELDSLSPEDQAAYRKYAGSPAQVSDFPGLAEHFRFEEGVPARDATFRDADPEEDKDADYVMGFRKAPRRILLNGD